VIAFFEASLFDRLKAIVPTSFIEKRQLCCRLFWMAFRTWLFAGDNHR
jgi:hypothetical protein